MSLPDAVDLTRALIRCPSVTPADAGALDLIADALVTAGFECRRADRAGTPNLIARWGPKGHPRTFGFNGHTDVVPAGDPADWTHDPFGAVIADGQIWGRGATDMKSGVAAFVAAACGFVTETPPDGAVLITVTGDEEGDATDGTAAILDAMAAEGEAMTVCLVGEPTSPETLGEMMKIGRRGSLTAHLVATGVQGHVAYPHRARNPVAAMASMVDRLSRHVLDEGTAHFDPSTLAVTTIDTGNPATNVIPASCRATVNIRFNDAHDADGLIGWLRATAEAVTAETGVAVEMSTKLSGAAFLTPPGAFSDTVAGAVRAVTGLTPVASTTGGTSDARFIRAHCPVVEFGLVGRTMHQVDERVAVADVETLALIYRRVLEDWFA